MANNKDQKKDVAVFLHHIKEMMNNTLEHPQITLNRDLQNFLYGRIAMLSKHYGKPIGSIPDIAAVVGVSMVELMKEFTCDFSGSPEELKTYYEAARHAMIEGYDHFTPVFDQQIDNLSDVTDVHDTSIQ